jgi:hypothetical protein
VNNAGIGYKAQIHMTRTCKIAMEVVINQGKYIFHESSSSSYIFLGVGLLVDPFRSHVSRRLFKSLP